MSLKLGNTDINGLFLGNTAINQAYLGSVEIFSAGGPPNGLLNGLVSYYKCDTNGSFPDAHGSNNGTINGATFTASGKINGGYDFDGVNDYIDLPEEIVNNGLKGSSAITLSFWIKRASISSNQIIFFSRTTSNNAGIDLLINTSNRIRVSGRSQVGDSFKQGTTSSSFTSTTEWYNVIAEWDYAGDRLRLYVDDTTVLDAFASFGSSTLNFDSNRIELGTLLGSSLNPYFDGVMDEVSMWGRKLTPEDRTLIYNGGAGLAYSNFTV